MRQTLLRITLLSSSLLASTGLFYATDSQKPFTDYLYKTPLGKTIEQAQEYMQLEKDIQRHLRFNKDTAAEFLRLDTCNECTLKIEYTQNQALTGNDSIGTIYLHDKEEQNFTLEELLKRGIEPQEFPATITKSPKGLNITYTNRSKPSQRSNDCIV